MGMVPDDIETFQLGACWDTASITREVLKRENSVYVATTDKKPQSFIVSASEYDTPEVSEGSGGAGAGSASRHSGRDSALSGMENFRIQELIVVVLFKVYLIILVFI